VREHSTKLLTSVASMVSPRPSSNAFPALQEAEVEVEAADSPEGLPATRTRSKSGRSSGGGPPPAEVDALDSDDEGNTSGRRGTSALRQRRK
jgi:hypothetical protein